MRRSAGSPETRFWPKVRLGPDCWEWTGARTAPGWHGVFAVDATRAGRTMVVAHRFAWELARGPIPSGMEVCHRCDNPACVRVDHLFLGSHKDNMVDAGRKGRLGTTRGVCRKGHLLVGYNRIHDPATGRGKCRICRDARMRAHRLLRGSESCSPDGAAA